MSSQKIIEARREKQRKESNFFRPVTQWEFIPPGRGPTKGAFRLPVFYYDNTAMSAIYTASTEKVRQHLPHSDLHPVELYPGRCLVAFSAFEYRDSDIDPYNEFSIAFLVTIKNRGIPGWEVLRQMGRRCFQAFVWHLPVTTEIARYGGVELYGFPKFIADIRFQRGSDFLQCSFSEKKKHILTLKGPALPTSRGKMVRFKTYPVLRGGLLCGNVYTDHLEYAERRNPSGVELSYNTDHAIGRDLSQLDLGKKPLLYQYSPRNEIILFGPRNLIDD